MKLTNAILISSFIALQVSGCSTEPTKPAIVATAAIYKGHAIDASVVAEQPVAVSRIPVDPVLSASELTGQVVGRDIAGGEPIAKKDILSQPTCAFALTDIPANKIMEANDFEIRTVSAPPQPNEKFTHSVDDVMYRPSKVPLKTGQPILDTQLNPRIGFHS